ncbi:MAG: DUF3536 domain-containing protein [Desulfovibrionales bacterium]|nr:DUF3536 domain-containing protein [Desulfovibrionales bacterium]
MKKSSSKRFICMHGHFYQPPRENPWLEAVEIQDSAFPCHDWNERVNAEGYAPNSRSRMLDNEGRIINIVNNYDFISFNFGPTLLSWMSEYAPETLRWIIEGDRLSCERYNGHGNAVAQVYNHVIMPLAGSRDKETQVKWGIADFRYRFGRQPEGMWLAETAVDTATLEALAAEGVRFTILAPRQAKQCRPLGKKMWTALDGNIDTLVPYLCRLPSGREIAIFFYHAAIAHSVAFEGLLNNGDNFYNRLLSAFDWKEDNVQLAHVATDGESYGHHHRFGDMALAYALNQIHKDPRVEIINYAAFLEQYPPQWEVMIHEDSSWSCVHGVERWRADCGCNAGHPGWHQGWRAPLRLTLDSLKKRLDRLFVLKGAGYFADPWAARNAYINIILDRSPESINRFFKEQGRGVMSQESRVSALKLLEMQRHSLLMFTSCGWFFDEISGLETTQILKYACRAIQLARAFGEDLEGEFVTSLEKAPSNVGEYSNGRGVWEKIVKPAMVDLERVLAHYAVSSIYHERIDQDRIYCFDITCHDIQVDSHGSSDLAVGRLSASSRLTLEEKDMTYAVLHFGGLDFHCVLCPSRSPEEYEELKRQLFKNFKDGSPGNVYAVMLKEFPESTYRLEDIFIEERRRLIEIALGPRLEEYNETFERLARQDEGTIRSLAGLSYPIPRQMLVAISNGLDWHLVQTAQTLPSTGAFQEISALWEYGRRWNYQPYHEKLNRILTPKLEEVLGELRQLDPKMVLASAHEVLEVARMFNISLDLWRSQNLFLDFCSECARPEPSLRKSFEDFALRIGLSKEILKWPG